MNRLKVPVLCFCLILLFSSCKKFDEFIPTVNISVYDPGGGAMLNNIASRNSSDVWVTTSDGKVLKSSNQGASWTSYTVGGIELNLSSLSVPSSQVIYTSGLEGFTNRLYKSMDGGMSWTLMAGSLEFKSCSFPDNNTGYSISDGSLYKTSNGAVYWEYTNSLMNAFGPWLVEFCSASTGLILDFDGSVYRTSDGGLTTEAIFINPNPKIVDIKFISPQEGYTVDYFCGIYKTTDAGLSWSLIHSYNDYNATSIDAKGNTVIAVGESSILISTNGGSTFTNYFDQHGVSVADILKDVVLLNPNKAIAIGASGKIYTISIL